MPTHRRLPELDSLRGLAAMAVLGWHIARELPFPKDPWAEGLQMAIGFNGHGGRFGIIFFFLLSGYLITWRILQEHGAGRFRLGRFLLRRALRIWPLHYAVLLIGFVLIPFLSGINGHAISEQAPWWLYALFLANFSMLWHGDPSIGTLGVQWSVSIEEQFYLLWPMLLMLLNRTRLFMAAIAIIVIASHGFAMASDGRTAYFHLLGNLRYLGLGAIIGVLVHDRGIAVAGLMESLPKALRSVFVVILPCVLFLISAWAADAPRRLTVLDGLAIGGFCLLLLERTYAGKGMLRLDAWKPLPWLGERSYGLYLLHMPALAMSRWLTDEDPKMALAAVLLTLLLSCVFADASLRWIERPFLLLKDRVR